MLFIQSNSAAPSCSIQKKKEKSEWSRGVFLMLNSVHKIYIYNLNTALSVSSSHKRTLQKNYHQWRKAKDKSVLHTVAGLLLSLHQMSHTVNPIDTFS